MASPRASIIIRCYNEREHIEKLLHGIFQQSVEDIEVILVDSGSTDGTLEVAEQYPVDEIVYIAPEEFSFGRALNYGCEAASGDFCVMASAHVYPKRDDWLETLLGKFDDEDVALVYGKQRGNDVTTFSENQIFKQWFPEHDIDNQQHPFCNNANAAIRRELWEKYPYDEQLPGLEDLDWAKRVQKEGHKIAYASDAEIIHVHDESKSEIYNRYLREAYAHKEIMTDQSFSFWDFLKLSVSNIVSDYKTAFAQNEALENCVSIPTFRLLQFWGTYRGFAKEGPMSGELKQRFYYPDQSAYPMTDDAEEQSDTDQVNQIEYPDSDELTGPGAAN